MVRKVHTGPNGGKYVMRYGKKRYLNKFGATLNQNLKLQF